MTSHEPHGIPNHLQLWNPVTKGQQCGEYFQIMRLSWPFSEIIKTYCEATLLVQRSTHLSLDQDGGYSADDGFNKVIINDNTSKSIFCICYRILIHRVVSRITWWRHQMEFFFALLPIWSPVNSPRKGQWRGALMFSLICVWINGWVNNREAGDLRRYRAHYDVTLMNRDRFASAKRWVGNKLSSYPKMIAPVCFEYTDSIFIYGCTKTTHVTCQVPCLNL